MPTLPTLCITGKLKYMTIPHSSPRLVHCEGELFGYDYDD